MKNAFKQNALMFVSAKLRAVIAIAVIAVIGFTTAACDDGSVSSSPYPPYTPEWLRTTGATVSSISLQWERVQNADGYNVYRSSSYNGHYTQVGSTPSTSYTNTGLNSDATWYYKVTAYNRAGESSRSDYTYQTTLHDGTTYLQISGTPRVGQTLSARSVGSGWSSNSYIWGWNDEINGTFWSIRGETGSTYTITSDHRGHYIRAFRWHPSGNWLWNNTENEFASNFLGPVQ
jgi:hypothetical protein